MNNDNPPSESREGTSGWPLGQLTISLFGLAMCLASFGTILEAFGLALGVFLESLSGLLFLAGRGVGLVAVGRTWYGKHRSPPPRCQRWLRIANISLWGTYFVTLMLTILVPAIRAGIAAARHHQSLENGASAETKEVTSSDGRFAIDVPANWHDISHIVPTMFVGIAQADAAEQLGVLVTVEARENLAVRSLEDYSRSCLARLAMDFEQFDVLETTTSSLPGRPAREILAGAVTNGSRLTFLLRFAETPQSYIQLRAWGAPSELRAQEKLLREILGSFREANAPESKEPR